MTPQQQVSTTTMVQQQQQQQQHSLIMYNDEEQDNDLLCHDLDQVLEHEEDIMEDEEIHSYDEDGQPIVDLDQIERRNLTVALVKSVVDTSSAKPPLVSRYGLRRRRRRTESPSQEEESVKRMEQELTTVTPNSNPGIPLLIPPATGIPILRKPPPLIKPPPLKSTPITCAVPNPLLHTMSPSVSSAIPPTTLPSDVSHQVSSTKVPCPLPAPIKQEEFSRSRGRIFSIDIDPAGLDFPDMGMEILGAQADFTGSIPLPPISTTTSGTVTPYSNQAQNTLMPAPSARPAMPLFAISSSDAMLGGRDRAMSFEFFSFGINADEPLPPVTESGDGIIVYNHEQSQGGGGRPRGDSIIFDPISFRDGGIHEEKALLRSRTNSLDVPSVDELTIMNSPGFTPQPVPKEDDEEPTPVTTTTATTQMATLPSSLNNTMNHATFQMDLLNKDGRIGIYLPDSRKARIAKFHSKRKMRIWRKRIKYDCRKKLADSRPRIKGRFVKRSDMDDDEE